MLITIQLYGMCFSPKKPHLELSKMNVLMYSDVLELYLGRPTLQALLELKSTNTLKQVRGCKAESNSLSYRDSILFKIYFYTS